MKFILTITLIGLSGCTAVGLVSDIVISDAVKELKEKTEIKVDSEENDKVKGIEHNNNDKDIEKSKKKKEEKHKTYFPLTKTGWEMDKLIIKKIFSIEDKTKKIKKDTDDRACTENNSRQICTAVKGCWCEKTQTKN